MKNSIYALVFLILSGVVGCENEEPDLYSDEFRDITSILSYQDFEEAKEYILQNGDQLTYCSKYLNNPHYSFSSFETFLSPEIGQRNINCDPDISDFNEIVIRDQETDQQYYHIFLVRTGDIAEEEISVYEGMKEKKVYLIKRHNYDLDDAESIIPKYIEEIKEGINGL